QNNPHIHIKQIKPIEKLRINLQCRLNKIGITIFIAISNYSITQLLCKWVGIIKITKNGGKKYVFLPMDIIKISDKLELS
ncbi:MAG: hypothetical protein IIY16_02475, partial [Oscillospiraceae bacterium]|nr:hypothetical protein [Oscillospiraceae bacterium]